MSDHGKGQAMPTYSVVSLKTSKCDIWFTPSNSHLYDVRPHNEFVLYSMDVKFQLRLPYGSDWAEKCL